MGQLSLIILFCYPPPCHPPLLPPPPPQKKKKKKEKKARQSVVLSNRILYSEFKDKANSADSDEAEKKKKVSRLFWIYGLKISAIFSFYTLRVKQEYDSSKLWTPENPASACIRPPFCVLACLPDRSLFALVIMLELAYQSSSCIIVFIEYTDHTTNQSFLLVFLSANHCL